MLGAVGAVVTTYWFGLAEAVEPPDSDSRVFLSAFAFVAGAILTFVTLYLTHRFGPRPAWIASAAVLTAAVGTVAWFTYEGHYEARVAVATHRDGRSEQIIITEQVTPAAIDAALRYGFCATEALETDTRQVSFACARDLAVELYGANWAIFDVAGLEDSRRLLVGWYRFAALSFMLALFLVVDAIATGVLKPRAPVPGATPIAPSEV